MNKFHVVAGVAIVAAALGLSACGQQRTAPKGLTRIHFDFDKYNIKPEFQGTMKGNAAAIQAAAGKRLTIEGHCDERGSTEYNIALGDRRAKSAKSYLQNLGVAADRMSTISYGEERPLCNQHNEGCWSQNRRAEFRW
ncbi:MAG: peptidoglycan-associated lipoprotein Pal [Deltaproteobacteria bacterium]|nr:peptidoglycan-associated lipoprotein Pal [Deltaproteobacteria bacterium]